MSTPTESPQSLEAFVASSRARKERNERRQVEGFIYFVRCERYIKIGFSDKPQARVKSFETSNPFPCEFLGSVPGGMMDERALHERFRQWHHRGEWFYIPPLLLHTIDDLLAGRTTLYEVTRPKKLLR